jgi:hypothetical protein
MHHVDKYGIGKVVDMALDKINPGRDRPVSPCMLQADGRFICHSMLMHSILHSLHLRAHLLEVG